MRHKQPYLVNPFNPLNPYETFVVPSRKMVAHTDNKGKFIEVAKIGGRKKKKTHAKKVSSILGKRLLKTAKSKKHLKKAVKRVVRRAIKRKHFKRAVRKNPILAIGNPISRRISMRKRHYRKNPLGFLKQREGKEILDLAIDGAVIVVSSTASKLLMDKVAEKVSFLNKPIGKIAGHLGLGALIYVGGNKVKKIPSRYVRLATLGAMMPAIIDVIDMVKSKVSGVKEIGYSGVSAFVPETSAFVPETSDLGDYDADY